MSLCTCPYNLCMRMNMHQYNNCHSQLNIQMHNFPNMMKYMKCHNPQNIPYCILLCNHFYKWSNIR
ncbi:MAG: hypothetical protein IJ692_03425 [Alloprevotella sp.]|nr:hypothetical protein [Alloprevotella sp.]